MEEKRRGTASASTPQNAGAKVANNGGNIKDLAIILQFFRYREATTLEAFIETGIMRWSITWYVRYLEDAGLLQVVKRGADPITGHTAKFYSADPAKWQKPKHLQLSLFNEKEV